MTAKTLALLTLVLLTIPAAAGSGVTRQQAQAEARRFLAAQGKRLASTAPFKAPAATVQGDLQSAGGDLQSPSYYVFNAADSQGFVVVSGDERTVPVLGYTDSGSFDEDTMPDGLRWLLQCYTEQMAQLDSLFALYDANKLETSANDVGLYNKISRHTVAPLLPMTWNQGDPYNQLCPIYYNEDGTQGGRSATGCVATAMAQVIGYYRWPVALKRSIPGYIQKYSTSQGEKSVRLNTIPTGSVIDWDNILDNYNGSETEEQKKAIAELMLWVGMDCKMNYGASSSSGFSEGIDGLVNYFDYDDGTHVAKRDMYTLQQWNDLIYNEIATGHPVPFGGQNSGGGHAFVLDGYDASGLFHVNWGWGGMSNSYYRIDILDPGNSSGIGASLTPGGYNMGQDAIIGMRLPDGVKADEEDTPQYRYKLSANDWELRGTNRFFANYVNWSGVSATWNMGIGYVNEEGKLTPIGNTATAQIGQNSYSSQEFTVRGLAEGVYHIVPISKRSNDTAWRTNMSPELRYVYTEVDASGNVVKMEIRPIVNLALTSLEFPGNHKRGDDQTVRATFRNEGEDELFTEIHLLASLTEEKGEALCRTAIDVEPGAETTISLNFKPEQNGTWNVWLATDHEGRNIVGEGSVEITDEGAAPRHQLKYMSHTVNNRTNGNVYGNCFQGRVVIQNINTDEPFDGTVRLWLFKEGEGGFYDAGSIYVPLQIEPRRTAQAPYYFDNLELGANYAMSILYAEGGDIQDGGLRAMGRPQAGIVYWQQNQSLVGMAPQPIVNTPSGAIAIDMTGLAKNINSVRPNMNKNTLYIFGENEEIPVGLEGCNVVRGNRAETIVLADSLNFFAPKSFVAREVSFSRLFLGNRWETLTLPFTPSFASVQGDAPLMLTFVGETPEGEAQFEDTKSIEAGLPCLVSFPNTGVQTFTATDAVIQSSLTPMTLTTDQYQMVGTTLFTAVPDGYVLNEEGTAFLPSRTNTRIAPFRAYFTSATAVEQIDVMGETVGISSPLFNPRSVQGNMQSPLYDLQGRQIVNRNSSNRKLSKGLYIQNGKKVILP
ncbi:MAG: C10 family peptidase [Prevotella sp.]|nr:C10 family peptidase [Prevotella sp.]